MQKLFFDLECIVPNAAKLVDENIEEFEYCASNKNLVDILGTYNQGFIDENEYRNLLENYFDYRDRVLEEVDDKYKNKIDYKLVYNEENVNQEILKQILTISKNQDASLIFYFNTPNEYNAKEALCKRICPGFKIIGIKYYDCDYDVSLIRNRVNKAEYIRKMLNIDSLIGCILYDKSFMSRREWQNLGGDTFNMMSLINSHSVNLLEDNGKKISK